MYRLGDQFLADPGFSSDQNVQVGTCHHFDLSFQLLHDLAEPDHFGAGFARRDMTDRERRNGLTFQLLDQQRIGQGSRSEGAHQSQLFVAEVIKLCRVHAIDRQRTNQRLVREQR